jgi:hypothetical protein
MIYFKEKVAAPSYKTKITVVGVRRTDHATHHSPQKLALTSSTSAVSRLVQFFRGLNSRSYVVFYKLKFYFKKIWRIFWVEAQYKNLLLTSLSWSSLQGILVEISKSRLNMQPSTCSLSWVSLYNTQLLRWGLFNGTQEDFHILRLTAKKGSWVL